LANVVQRADMGMVQARNGPGLALEALAELRIAGKMFGKNLDGNDAVNPRIFGASPIPPAPIEEMISYGPSRVEGWRDMAVACSLPHQSVAWNANGVGCLPSSNPDHSRDTPLTSER